MEGLQLAQMLADLSSLNEAVSTARPRPPWSELTMPLQRIPRRHLPSSTRPSPSIPRSRRSRTTSRSRSRSRSSDPPSRGPRRPPARRGRAARSIGSAVTSSAASPPRDRAPWPPRPPARRPSPATYVHTPPTSTPLMLTDPRAGLGRRRQGQHAACAAGDPRQAEAAGQHEPDEGAREGQRAGRAPACTRGGEQQEAQVHISQVSFARGAVRSAQRESPLTSTVDVFVMNLFLFFFFGLFVF